MGAAGGRDTRAACWASGPGGTWPRGKRKAKCQALGRGLWPPHLMSHLILVSPEAMDCSCISLMNTLGLLLSAAEVVGVRSEVGVEWGDEAGRTELKAGLEQSSGRRLLFRQLFSGNPCSKGWASTGLDHGGREKAHPSLGSPRPGS